MSCILKVTDVCVHLATENGSVRAVDNASFSIEEHETFALIGESGSGKSILCLAVMRFFREISRLRKSLLRICPKRRCRRSGEKRSGRFSRIHIFR